MRSREQIVEAVLDAGLIAIVRLDSADHLLKTAEAIHAGGIRVIEFTLNTPGALGAIAECATWLGEDCIIGAGTVLTASEADSAIQAGAEIIVAPNTDPEVVGFVHGRGKVAIPGAYTPTEIAAAAGLGADFVKLFPAGSLGPHYVKEVLAPLDNVRIVPTGGVTPDNVVDYFWAGAAALAVGGSIVNNALVEAGDFAGITARARAMADAVAEARQQGS